MMSESEPGAERATSQTLKALLALRELLLRGEMAPGERVSELQMVERLGVSRTPIRVALVRLAEEGLLEAIPSGGFAVRAFTEAEINDAIELRGTLEGLAARLAAERGAGGAALADMREALAQMDLLVRAPAGALEDSFSRYIAHNARFHARLADLCGSAVIAQQIARAVSLPFASPSGFLRAQASLPQAHYVLVIGQEHHRAVLEAILAREGARAEALMREHARLARRNLQRVMRDAASLRLVPGGTLIRGEVA